MLKNWKIISSEKHQLKTRVSNVYRVKTFDNNYCYIPMPKNNTTIHSDDKKKKKIKCKQRIIFFTE